MHEEEMMRGERHMSQVERFETTEQYLEYVAEREDRDLEIVRREYRG